MRRFCFLSLLVLLACGDEGQPTEAPPAGDEAALIGTWVTEGEDPQLGANVDVTMDLMESGALRVTVSQPGGASLSFPGSWSLEVDRLHLRGVWFQPDGEVEVRVELEPGQMILHASDGSSQTWQRQASATDRE